jgi:hypothetical protein
VCEERIDALSEAAQHVTPCAGAAREWMVVLDPSSTSTSDPQGDRGYRRRVGLVRAVLSGRRGLLI